LDGRLLVDELAPVEEAGRLAGDVDPHGGVGHLADLAEDLLADAEGRPLPIVRGPAAGALALARGALALVGLALLGLALVGLALGGLGLGGLGLGAPRPPRLPGPGGLARPGRGRPGRGGARPRPGLPAGAAAVPPGPALGGGPPRPPGRGLRVRARRGRTT